MERTGSMLVMEIRSGSASAFEELMRRYRRLVYRIAYGVRTINGNVFVKDGR